MANTSYNTVTVTTTATKVVAANTRRKGLILTNESNVKVFIGPDDSITASNTVSIPYMGNLTNSGLPESWRGDVYAIVATGTADLRFWEYGA